MGFAGGVRREEGGMRLASPSQDQRRPLQYFSEVRTRKRPLPMSGKGL